MVETPRTPTGIDLVVSDAILATFLDEDLGRPHRDATTDALFTGHAEGAARLVAREGLVASGLEEAARIFQMTGARTEATAQDGDDVAAGACLLEVEGPTRSILRAERTALNIVARMSGIATLTRQVQDAVHAVAPDCRVAATRKTTPGFRVFEKRAVCHGGGDPHRFGLFDQLLLKDNHLAAVGDLAQAISRARAGAPGLLLEVEVENEEDAMTAARCGVDMILIDNRSVEECRLIAEAVRRVAPRILLEASGGIRPEDAAAYARYVDRVSLGALTMHAAAKDVGLDWTA